MSVSVLALTDPRWQGTPLGGVGSKKFRWCDLSYKKTQIIQGSLVSKTPRRYIGNETNSQADLTQNLVFCMIFGRVQVEVSLKDWIRNKRRKTLMLDHQRVSGPTMPRRTRAANMSTAATTALCLPLNARSRS